MAVELNGISSSFSEPFQRSEEERREITETSIKANKFFKGILNSCPDNKDIQEWVMESHKNLRETLGDRLAGVSRCIPNNLG
ncbi:MAG: hypothetical protein HRU43_00940 [Simkaniaceae bacterium]|nr:hypothetical protein [Simkaniaceae bacterium]